MKKKKPKSMLDILIEENEAFFDEIVSLRQDCADNFKDGFAIGSLFTGIVGLIVWSLLVL